MAWEEHRSSSFHLALGGGSRISIIDDEGNFMPEKGRAPSELPLRTFPHATPVDISWISVTAADNG